MSMSLSKRNKNSLDLNFQEEFNSNSKIQNSLNENKKKCLIVGKTKIQSLYSSVDTQSTNLDSNEGTFSSKKKDNGFSNILNLRNSNYSDGEPSDSETMDFYSNNPFFSHKNENGYNSALLLQINWGILSQFLQERERKISEENYNQLKTKSNTHCENLGQKKLKLTKNNEEDINCYKDDTDFEEQMIKNSILYKKWKESKNSRKDYSSNQVEFNQFTADNINQITNMKKIQTSNFSIQNSSNYKSNANNIFFSQINSNNSIRNCSQQINTMNPSSNSSSVTMNTMVFNYLKSKNNNNNNNTQNNIISQNKKTALENFNTIKRMNNNDLMMNQRNQFFENNNSNYQTQQLIHQNMNKLKINNLNNFMDNNRMMCQSNENSNPNIQKMNLYNFFENQNLMQQNDNYYQGFFNEMDFPCNSLENIKAAKTKKKTKVVRDGDWICLECQNHNFSFRVTCNKCSFKKEDLFSNKN